jgi:hypothetical protein
MGIIDKTRWGVIAVATLTATGHAELLATFMTKERAAAWLAEAVPHPTERRNRYKIVRMRDLPACVDPAWIGGRS